MDESGDLGFDFVKPKTSRYFIITFLFTKDKNPVEKLVKKIFSGFSKSEVKRHSGVLHCYKEHPTIRTKLLSKLNEKDVTIITIYLNKKKVFTRLQDERHVLYNYVTNILLDRVYSKQLVPLTEPVHLVAARRETNRFLNDNFKSYIAAQVNRNHKLKIHVEIKSPAEEKCLQIVDFACWAIFRKQEHGDDSYYNLIKQKIAEENPLFP
jgi:hypothetical protein